MIFLYHLMYMNVETINTFRIFPGRGWSASLLLQLALLFVPDLPAAHLLLAHATIKLLLLVVVQFFQQLGVHPQVLQDLLQHFDLGCLRPATQKRKLGVRFEGYEI